MKKILPALIALVALALPGAAAAQNGEVKYVDVYLEAGSTLTIHDDETFGYEQQTFNLAGYLGRFDSAKTMANVTQDLTLTRCVGGEVRVKLTVTRQMYAGAPMLHAKTSLFEGDSCSTTDFGGSAFKDFKNLIPGFSYAHNFYVVNDEGGDWAKANVKLKTVGTY